LPFQKCVEPPAGIARRTVGSGARTTAPAAPVPGESESEDAEHGDDHGQHATVHDEPCEHGKDQQRDAAPELERDVPLRRRAAAPEA
jgi:hypothetical protein